MKDDEFNPYMKFYGLFIPNGIAESQISDVAKLLLGRLMQYGGQDGRAYPSRKKLSSALCWSLPKLDRAIKTLKDLKLIRVVPLDEENKQSPNLYTFLKNPMYDTPLIKSDNTPVIRNDNTPLIKSDNTPLANMIGHNRVSIIEEKVNIKSFSYEKDADANGIDYNGLLCKVCKEKQFETKGGATCINGHGGVEGINPKDLAPKIKLGALKKIKISNPTETILQRWKKCGGRRHRSKDSQGYRIICQQINTLLVDGCNSYHRVAEPEMISKKWTVKEITNSIEYFAYTLKRDISEMYFDQFIMFGFKKYNGYKGKKNLPPDYSPLLDSFLDLPAKDSKTVESLKSLFEETFTNMDVYHKVFVNVAKFLEDVEKNYKVDDIGCRHKITVMFRAFMKQKVVADGTLDPLKYMSSEQNLKEFLVTKKKAFKLIKKVRVK